MGTDSIRRTGPDWAIDHDGNSSAGGGGTFRRRSTDPRSRNCRVSTTCCPLQCGEQNRFSFFPFFARNKTPHRHAVSSGTARGFERQLEGHGDLVIRSVRKSTPASADSAGTQRLATRYHSDDLGQRTCQGSIRHDQNRHIQDRVHVSVPEG
jgi:hypothetical protein